MKRKIIFKVASHIFLVQELGAEEKTNTTKSIVLRFVVDPVGYKIELIERDL
mgnify:CR=1 FL=1